MSTEQDKIELCHKDGRACYVGRGTDDAHWRCGTSQCVSTEQDKRALAEIDAALEAQSANEG